MNVQTWLCALSPFLLNPIVIATQSFPSQDPLLLNAKCLLQIDGETHLDDRCYFKHGEKTDSFNDLRMVINCPDGRSIEISRCIGAEQQVIRPGVFGFLFRSSEGTASLCWNAAVLRKATPCFEDLKRTGACWGNSQAPLRYDTTQSSSIKFCAWALESAE